MKILAFSDLHLDRLSADLILDQAPAADVVIGAGDFAQLHDGLDGIMALLEPIADKAIYVPGNNETDAALRAATSATVLHGQSVVRNGRTIAGIGAAVPPLVGNTWGSFDLEEAEAAALLDRVPAADILISHAPPKGVADAHATLGSIGSAAVRSAVERLIPILVFCGHIHDCWGVEGTLGAARVVNLGPRPRWFDV